MKKILFMVSLLLLILVPSEARSISHVMVCENEIQPHDQTRSVSLMFTVTTGIGLTDATTETVACYCDRKVNDRTPTRILHNFSDYGNIYSTAEFHFEDFVYSNTVPAPGEHQINYKQVHKIKDQYGTVHTYPSEVNTNLTIEDNSVEPLASTN